MQSFELRHLHHSHNCVKPLLLHCLGILFRILLLKLEANPQTIRIRIKKSGFIKLCPNLVGVIISIMMKPACELALLIIGSILILAQLCSIVGQVVRVLCDFCHH